MFLQNHSWNLTLGPLPLQSECSIPPSYGQSRLSTLDRILHYLQWSQVSSFKCIWCLIQNHSTLRRIQSHPKSQRCLATPSLAMQKDWHGPHQTKWQTYCNHSCLWHTRNLGTFLTQKRRPPTNQTHRPLLLTDRKSTIRERRKETLRQWGWPIYARQSKQRRRLVQRGMTRRKPSYQI